MHDCYNFILKNLVQSSFFFIFRMLLRAFLALVLGRDGAVGVVSAVTGAADVRGAGSTTGGISGHINHSDCPCRGCSTRSVEHKKFTK